MDSILQRLILLAFWYLYLAENHCKNRQITLGFIARNALVLRTLEGNGQYVHQWVPEDNLNGREFYKRLDLKIQEVLLKMK